MATERRTCEETKKGFCWATTSKAATGGEPATAKVQRTAIAFGRNVSGVVARRRN